ncbi:MAG: hypothetical protein WBX15_15910 [Thermoanaerobaculia bacterium]
MAPATSLPRRVRRFGRSRLLSGGSLFSRFQRLSDFRTAAHVLAGDRFFLCRFPSSSSSRPGLFVRLGSGRCWFRLVVRPSVCFLRLHRFGLAVVRPDGEILTLTGGFRLGM